MHLVGTAQKCLVYKNAKNGKLSNPNPSFRGGGESLDQEEECNLILML